MSASLQLEVVSDLVCPWCYVGKRRLERALAAAPELNVAVIWRPYQLSPDMPRAGRLKSEHYESIFGAERAAQIQSSMRETGREEGIDFGSSPAAVSPNTLSAHVLLHWATLDPAVDEQQLAESLFAAHHVDCRNIGDPEVLAALASAAGMDGADVLERLQRGDDEAVVLKQIAEAQSRGVTGVPFFIINGRYGLSGAQPPEVLQQALAQVASEQQDAAG